MFEQFVKDWGAWSISVLSLGVAALALVNSRRAVRIAATEHAWKAEDRARMLATEEMAAEERAWCERVRHQLDIDPDLENGIAVPDDKLDWALRGDGKYFRVVRQGNVTFIYSLARHHGPLLG